MKLFKYGYFLILPAIVGAVSYSPPNEFEVIQRAYTNSVGKVVSGDAVGTGFVVGPNTVMTAYHVIEHFDKGITFSVGTATYKATLQAGSATDDIALLYIKETHLKPLPMFTEYRLGEEVYSIGYTYNMGKFVSKGIITSLFVDMISTDVGASFGNSGGPILNKRGEVIGMLVSGKVPVTFAIPSRYLISFMHNVEE